VIQHVVMWKLVDLSEAERTAALDRFDTELRALVGVVPGLASVARTRTSVTSTPILTSC